MGKKPLETIKVVEIGNAVSAPFCGAMFADFGAEVIKIETPGVGDSCRGFGNTKDLWFAVENRNKKCISLNMRTPEGKEILKKLLSDADVLLENFRPGALKRLGFGWDEVHTFNPKCVMVDISGFGQDGPYALKPGYDRMGLAMGGLTYLTGYPDTPPVRPGLAITDYLTGLFGFAGALMALYNRDAQEGKEGQRVDACLYASILRIMEYSLADYSYSGAIRERIGNAHPSMNPGGNYLTKDGKYCAISVGGDKIFRAFVTAIGKPELADDERYATATARMSQRKFLDDLAKDFCAEHTLQECLSIFGDQVPASAIYSVEDIFNDPHIQARGDLTPVDTTNFGTIKMQGVYPRLSETPGEIKWAGPEKIGEFNGEVLSALGYTEEQQKELKEKGVI